MKVCVALSSLGIIIPASRAGDEILLKSSNQVSSLPGLNIGLNLPVEGLA